MAGLPLDECGCNSKGVALPATLSLSLSLSLSLYIYIYIYIYIYYRDLFKTDFQVIITKISLDHILANKEICTVQSLSSAR